MSVWPKPLPPLPALSGSEGALVSVSIHVDPRCLESLLEALAQVSFPINPQIYHEAVMVCRYADGRETVEDIALVEFPAYDRRLDEVRRALDAGGFDPASMRVAGMLDEIHSGRVDEAAPVGAEYVARYLLKRKSARIH
ncbi:MAG: hypothetical protein ABSC23_03285 [Bryobacteraceae bacterium]|jgi:hypothetical protein